ncbi:MAG: LPS export ABC transporter periplasmic protein LptC, partial [Duncaniella sp.]|nr:LPS export ABC transporter periplasmic protein LptC [Duncaniella sp.]
SNVMNEKFLTEQLFWNQRQRKLYSDSFIHIETSDKVLEGYGFDSNEQLTRYSIRKVSGIFPANAFKRKDSIQ